MAGLGFGRLGSGRWSFAACAAVLALAAMGNPKAAAPEVVVHPLTAEERLQEADYMAYEPLMEGLDAFSRADPAKLEERARMLMAGSPATDSPFVDWARYAALAVAEMDPAIPADQVRAAGWAGPWDALAARAKALFADNERGRAETLADNLLCGYRETEALKAECLSAAAAGAKRPDPALATGWPGWVLDAALGLEKPVADAGGWEGYGRRLRASGRGPEQAAELRRKTEALSAWAGRLNAAQPRLPYDAMGQARSWAGSSRWVPGRPKGVERWVGTPPPAGFEYIFPQGQALGAQAR